MSSIYNKAFKIGVAVNLIAFGVTNLFSYWIAYRAPNEGISFSGGNWLVWGFPFYWLESTGIGLILNIFVIAMAGFVCGFIFRFVSAKIFSTEEAK
jgi:hypothetical protein